MNFGDYSYGSGGGGQDFSSGGGNQSFSHGGGGGGWMTSTAGPSGGDDDDKVRGGYKNQTLRPVTIKQLVEVPVATDNMPVSIDGDEIKQVTFVGTVREINEQPMSVMYSIEDGTGRIDVRMWLNSSGDEGGGQARDHMLDPAIAKGKYVRVYGELRFYNGSRSVSALKLRAVTDHNEVTYHGLEATYVHLAKTRGAPVGAGGAVAAGSAYAGAANGGYGGVDTGMKASHAAVLEAVKGAPQSPEGVNIATIQQSLSARFGGNEIGDSVTWLINEGHLFTTIDDAHVQTSF